MCFPYFIIIVIIIIIILIIIIIFIIITEIVHIVIVMFTNNQPLLCCLPSGLPSVCVCVCVYLSFMHNWKCHNFSVLQRGTIEGDMAQVRKLLQKY
jgi:hypothetical protein